MVTDKKSVSHFELTEEDVEILNSKIGMKYLFASTKVNLEKVLRMARYEVTLREMQAQLIELQNWVINKQKKVVILFEGRDAAGKGGAIRRIAAHINPRHYRIVALPKPYYPGRRPMVFSTLCESTSEAW